MKFKKLSEMTLKEKIGQLILAGFHSTTYDEHLRTLIEDYHVSNIIMFTRNFESASQMHALTKKIHEQVFKYSGVIPFIAIDQEGGLVTRMMRDVTFAPGPMTTSASIDKAAYLTGKMLAEDMIKLGMNLNLAPSLDVNNNALNPVINVRSLSDDPKVVASLGRDFIKGTKEVGVLACAKHFPGHGDCAVDSHLGLPTINYDLDRIHQIEMYPFMKNIDVPAIMSAHILFPEIDNVPATLSKKVLTNILREELGYKGLILTDCLEMKAIATHYGTSNGALAAIKAGADIACISHTLEYQLEALKLIERSVLNNEIKVEELDAHVERILEFKEATYPYLEKYFYNQKELTFSEESKRLSQEIVDKSLTLVKGNMPTLLPNSLVIAPKAMAKTIIEDEFDNRNLAEVLQKTYNNIKVYEYNDSKEFKEQILNELPLYQNVIFFSYNAVVNPTQVELINEILKIKNAYVISLKGPMDYHLYNNLNNYMCMYEYTPNSIRTIIKFFNNEITPMGKLPIKL